MDYLLLFGIGTLFLLIGFLIGRAVGYALARRSLKDVVQSERQDAIKRSRSVLAGQFSEQISPHLPKFPYKPTEVRFIGKPIDFIAFKGIDNGEIEEVGFIEVKSGKSTLSSIERKLKQAIEKKTIKWTEYRV